MQTVTGEDRLSSNAFLCHILSLLDAKQVLRCMRVSKQFYNIIKNNWKNMQKIALNLEVKHTIRYNDGYTNREYGYNPVEKLIEVSSSPGNSKNFVTSKDSIRYSFTIGSCFVRTYARGRCLPVLDVFECRKKLGFRSNISSQGATVDTAIPKRGFKRIVRSMFSKSPAKTSSAEQHLHRESWLEGAFDTSDCSEGLSIVLDMLMRCDIQNLTLNSTDITEEQLQIILRCIQKAGTKLISTAKVFHYSETVFEILKQLDAKTVQIQPDIILDCATVRKLPTGIWNMEIIINGTLFNSLKPIAILIEEWQQGNREIRHLELLNKKCARPYMFSVSSIRELLRTFEMTTVTDTTPMDLRGFVARKSDSKMLFIDYSLYNLWLRGTTL